MTGLTFLLLTAAAMPKTAPDLAAPFALTANGKPISVDIGHAAPFIVDWDGDGKRDLLVGQFGGGSLRIYSNIGTQEKPRFGAFKMLQSGGKTASVDFG